ncbi:MAG: hydrolase, partial [Bacteroidota bacterium]
MASVGAIAQQNPGFELHIKKAKAPVKVDGILDEPDWQEANVASNFFLNYPTDSIAANFQTEARITFDQNFLYLAWVCHDDQKPLVVQSLRRDFEWPLNDNA